MLVEDGVPQVRTSSELQCGALRKVVARERHGALSRKVLYRSIPWIQTRFGESRGQLDRRRDRGVLSSLCARITGANREVSEGKSDLWPRSIFFLRGPARSGERARFMGQFSGMQRTLDG